MALLRQHTDETAQRIHVVWLRSQNRTVRGIGTVQITGFRIQITQGAAHTEFVGPFCDGLFVELNGTIRIAGRACGLSAANGHPEPGAVQGLGPPVTAARIRCLCALQILGGFRKLFLAQQDDADTTEGIRAARFLAQNFLELGISEVQVTSIQVPVGLGDQVIFGGFHRAVERREPLRDLAVLAEAVEERTVVALVPGFGRQPHQCLTPTSLSLFRDHGVIDQLRQVANPLAPGFFAVGQMLCQRELVNRLIRIGFSQFGQSVARLTPPVRGASQGLVVLQREPAIRTNVPKCIAIGLHRLVVLAVLSELTRLIQALLIDRALGNGRLQFTRTRVVRVAGRQLIQILLCDT